MTWTMGFDFRTTAGLVTDPADCVCVAGEAYPHLYTNSNGDSVNAGWSASVLTYDSGNYAGNDPRVIGGNYHGNDSSSVYFQVDLSSGNCPGAGDYLINLAMGLFDFGQKQSFKLMDNATMLLDGTNGGSGYATAQYRFIDATLATAVNGPPYGGTPALFTFSSTTLKLIMSIDTLSDNSTAAHLHLDFQGAAATGNPWLQYRLMMSH